MSFFTSFLHASPAKKLPQDDKPVLVSFPKAGRTWLRVLLDELNLEVHCTHDRSDHSKKAHFNTLRASKAPYAQAKTAPRKVIFLARDPRDTVVSGFFQCTARHNYFEGDMASFIRDPRHGLPKICHFYAQWQREGAKLPQFHLVKYEDLHANCEAELRRVTEFLIGNAPDEARLQAALEAGKFDVMKSREKAGFYQQKFGDALVIDEKSAQDPNKLKTREGKVGGFAKHFSEDDQKYALETMEKAGFPFGYGSQPK